MADVINLRRARKDKKREDAGKTAATNRALHGRTLEEREREEMMRARARAELDGKKLEDNTQDGQ